MLKIKQLLENNSGMTLVEVLVTGIIAAIVIGSAVIFFGFTGNRLQSVITDTQFGQESNFIIEHIARNVRSGGTINIPVATQLDILDAVGVVSYRYTLAGGFLKGGPLGGAAVINTPFRFAITNAIFQPPPAPPAPIPAPGATNRIVQFCFTLQSGAITYTPVCANFTCEN